MPEMTGEEIINCLADFCDNIRHSVDPKFQVAIALYNTEDEGGSFAIGYDSRAFVLLRAPGDVVEALTIARSEQSAPVFQQKKGLC